MDPTPDYDLSDELEYGTAAFAWLLRGVYPPPGYPPIWRDRRVVAQGTR